MSETYQAAAPGLSSTTRILVVAYHFLIAAGLIGVLVVEWGIARESGEGFRSFGELIAVVAPFIIIYSMAGWGILKWKNWSRTLSLVLNWINVVAAVVTLARHSDNPEAFVGVLLSCLVLWWLSVPVVKMEFQRRSEAR
jgi:cytochrome b561